MADKTNLDVVKLEKRMCELERIFLALNDILSYMEASLRALEKWVDTSMKANDAKMNVMLRAVVRHRGLAPKQRTTKHLIKALVADEYGVKLHFKKAAGRS